MRALLLLALLACADIEAPDCHQVVRQVGPADGVWAIDSERGAGVTGIFIVGVTACEAGVCGRESFLLSEDSAIGGWIYSEAWARWREKQSVP